CKRAWVRRAPAPARGTSADGRMRYRIWLLAIGATVAVACHHDVTATVANGDPCIGPGDAPLPNCVSIAPTGATLRIGDTVRAVASVSANSVGSVWKFDWSSSDTTRAVVDATGLVRAVNTIPGAAVCATLRAYPS